MKIFQKTRQERFSEEITSSLAEMHERHVIDRDAFEFLRPKKIRTSRFYILPKIHKDGIPGRPIVSSCGAPTENISLFVDYHLSPLVRRIPSYIKDTNDFLLKLQDIRNLPSGSLLVTLDVTSLYTNIPHEEGLDACREMLETRDVLDPPTDDIVNLTSLILKKNNFTFNGLHHLQKHGTAMGTRMAPSYANIFMGRLEHNLLQQVADKPSIWWRYIDDVFAIWPHGEESLITFLEEINLFHPTIRFTAEWSRESVTFLDTKVIRNGDSLVTDLFTKPTDTHQYLHRRSCHPSHCKKSIAFSQALRLRRICSRSTDYERHVQELKGYLIDRGYEGEEVQRQIDKATRIKREELLGSREKKIEQVTPLVVTFHPDLPHLTHILNDYQCVISTSPRLSGALPKPPLVAYRRPPNLRDLLVRAAYGQVRETYKGNDQCQQPRCKTCAHIKMGTTFRSTTTGQRFRVRATADCRTRNVVYLIECKKCAIQYVGETDNALRVRLTGHRSDINHHRTDRPVAQHFTLPDHSIKDLTIMVIEKIHREDINHRKRRESHWIEMIRSLTPDGLNLNP